MSGGLTISERKPIGINSISIQQPKLLLNKEYGGTTGLNISLRISYILDELKQRFTSGEIEEILGCNSTLFKRHF